MTNPVPRSGQGPKKAEKKEKAKKKEGGESEGGKKSSRSYLKHPERGKSGRKRPK